MPLPNFTISETFDPQMLRRIYDLRRIAWTSIGVNPNLASWGGWTDAHDSHARHWIVTEGSEIVAAARMCVHDILCEIPEYDVYEPLGLRAGGRVASINRLVVDPIARGMGLTTLLDETRILAARRAKCEFIVGYVSTVSGPERLKHLQRLGFEVRGRFGELCGPMGSATAVILSLKSGVQE